jgi:Uma2 family endonuclease
MRNQEMALALLAPPQPNVSDGPERKIWTRAELAEIESAGLFSQQRLELIEGELINKMGKNRPHSNSVSDIVDCLAAIFPARHVQQETTIDVSPQDNPTNEPQPDAIVLKLPRRSYESNPTPSDLLLVCEVSQSTLAFDLSTKANLYSRAGIQEYWVLDLQGRRLLVHREPSAVGYRFLRIYLAGEKVAPLAAPEATIEIDALLG